MHAFVTLLTSDAYLPGALTIAAALNSLHQSVEYETVCLVTPQTVDVNSIRLLRKAFSVVIGVEIILPPNTESLALLGRPELDTALTKLHVFRLTQYDKIIFLDADVLPLRPLSHLFHLDHEFSAVPDVGWPDIFNSGVMVLSPGEHKFNQLRELLNSKGSWDGADQGLLNEWRGSNWNRLSFTYNTTPTAIYTYAPAYQRFGSQISVVHFIGPHKPWHSLPSRAPDSSAQSIDMDVESSTKTPVTQQHAYDYGSLVDRWHSVYDRHCQSQAADPVFQPTKYTSAWNEGDVHHATAAGGALGLEELRRAALEGMGTSSISAPRANGEGEYRTLPLDGRFDLIAPRPRAERAQAQAQSDSIGSTPMSTTTPEPTTPVGQGRPLPSGSPVRWTTLPTPGIHEIPPAPQAKLISLPPTPFRHTLAPNKFLRTTREAEAQTVSNLLQQPEAEGVATPLTPPMWNSAVIQTPPNVSTPAPTDTYFPKVWDPDRSWSSVSSSSSDTSLATMESPSKLRPLSNAVFSPSVVQATPEALRGQRKHRIISREENGSPIPDPTKVKRVFPWEGRSRQAPGRVFSEEGSLLTLPHHPAFATPERKAIFRSPMPSPLVGFPPSFQSHYLSESPLPQRFISRSVPPSGPLSLENGPGRVETSSQDGDVEDEVDSEEETMVRSRMRSSSIEMTKHTSMYRSIGVQTDPRDLREEGVQVTTFVPVTEVAEKLVLMSKRLGRNWPTSTTPSSTRPLTSSLLSSPILDSLTTLAADEDSNPSLATSNPSAVPPFPGGSPRSSYSRKGSRVWDPARDVQAFKRGSEETLARFMKSDLS